MSEDPIGFEAGDANLRRYVGTAVVTGSDPTGLAVRVGPAHISYRDSIATLDSFVDGTPYKNLAEIAPHNNARLGIKYPPFTSAGVWTVENDAFAGPGGARFPKGSIKGASYLFFVSIPFCEDKPGEARLFLDETGSTTIENGVRQRDQDGRNYGDITGDPEVRVAKLTRPFNGFDKVLIYMDVPDGFAAYDKRIPIASNWKSTVQQKIQVKDSTGMVLTTIQHQVLIGVNKDKSIVSSP